MSVEVGNEDGPIGQFASNHGYIEFLDAVEDSTDYPHLKQFVTDGSTESVDEVITELGHMESSDAAADVISIAGELRNLLHGQHIAVISAGIEP